MPPSAPAEGDAPRCAHHRQPCGHAGVLEDALLKHVLEIGRIRHEERRVEDCPVLLGLAVDQIPVAVERVDGAWILHQRQPRRQQQHAAQRAAQQRFKGQRAEGAGSQFVPPSRQHAGKVNDEKHRLPGEEEVIVDKVQRHPKGEPPPFVVQRRIVQRRQHVGKQRHNV